MVDYFKGKGRMISGALEEHYEVVPSNTTDLSPVPNALFVNTDGVLAIRDKLGADVTYNVKAGDVIPFRAARVLETTTAAVVAWV